MKIATIAITAVLACAAIAGRAEISRADSYAEGVFDFSPVIKSGQPTSPHLGSENALGAPDYAGVNSCGSQASCTFVSLGDGGSITLRFFQNALTGSDSADPDLWIYEIGPDVEDTFVEISTDGITWNPVGKVFGSTSTVDIDAFGFDSSDLFTYVRLTDDTNEGAQTGSTVGADIDAVEALTAVPIAVQPTTWSLIKARY